MLEPIAKKLGIEPTFDALNQYMEKTFVPGLKRTEVHQQFEKFGDYEVLYEYGELVSNCEVMALVTGKPVLFDQGPLTYEFCYSAEEEVLTYWRFTDKFGGPGRYIE